MLHHILQPLRTDSVRSEGMKEGITVRHASPCRFPMSLTGGEE